MMSEYSYSNGSATQTVGFDIADGAREARVDITVPDNSVYEANCTMTAKLSVTAGGATVDS